MSSAHSNRMIFFFGTSSVSTYFLEHTVNSSSYRSISSTNISLLQFLKALGIYWQFLNHRSWISTSDLDNPLLNTLFSIDHQYWTCTMCSSLLFYDESQNTLPEILIKGFFAKFFRILFPSQELKIEQRYRICAEQSP